MQALIYNAHKIFFDVSLGAFLVLLIPFSSVALNQSNQPSPQFYCFPDSTGSLFTRVSIPNLGDLDLISWKKTASPRTTCDRISRRFQDFYKAGKLNYITGGKSQKTGLGMICGTAEYIKCNDERNKLFDLLPYTKPADYVANDLKKRLLDGSGKPIYQGSDNELVIDFQKLLLP